MKKLHVAKVVVTDGKDVLMAHRSIDDTNRPGQWDLLGGGARQFWWLREPTRTTAHRELKEEGGIKFPRRKLEPFYETSYSKVLAEGGEATIETVYLMARYAVLPETRPSGEHDVIQAFPLETAIEASAPYKRQQQVLQYIHGHNLLRGAYANN